MGGRGSDGLSSLLILFVRFISCHGTPALVVPVGCPLPQSLPNLWNETHLLCATMFQEDNCEGERSNYWQDRSYNGIPGYFVVFRSLVTRPNCQLIGWSDTNFQGPKIIFSGVIQNLPSSWRSTLKSTKCRCSTHSTKSRENLQRQIRPLKTYDEIILDTKPPYTNNRERIVDIIIPATYPRDDKPNDRLTSAYDFQKEKLGVFRMIRPKNRTEEGDTFVKNKKTLKRGNRTSGFRRIVQPLPNRKTYSPSTLFPEVTEEDATLESLIKDLEIALTKEQEDSFKTEDSKRVRVILVPRSSPPPLVHQGHFSVKFGDGSDTVSATVPTYKPQVGSRTSLWQGNRRPTDEGTLLAEIIHYEPEEASRRGTSNVQEILERDHVRTEEYDILGTKKRHIIEMLEHTNHPLRTTREPSTHTPRGHIFSEESSTEPATPDGLFHQSVYTTVDEPHFKQVRKTISNSPKSSKKDSSSNTPQFRHDERQESSEQFIKQLPEGYISLVETSDGFFHPSVYNYNKPTRYIERLGSLLGFPTFADSNYKLISPLLDATADAPLWFSPEDNEGLTVHVNGNNRVLGSEMYNVFDNKVIQEIPKDEKEEVETKEIRVDPPLCYPSEEFRIVMTCDGRTSEKDFVCNLMKRIGATEMADEFLEKLKQRYSKELKSKSFASGLAEKLGSISEEHLLTAISLRRVFSSLSVGGTGYDWRNAYPRIFVPSILEIPQRVQTKAGRCVKVEQVVGTCGSINVFTEMFQYRYGC